MSKPSIPIPDIDGAAAAGGWFATGCTVTKCACSRWPFEVQVARMEIKAAEIAVKRLAKAMGEEDDDQEGQEDDPSEPGVEDEDDLDSQGETSPGLWDELELALAALIARAYWKAAQSHVLPALKPYLNEAGAAFDDAGYHAALTSADQDLRNALHDALETDVRDTITQTLAVGEAQIRAGLLRGSNSVATAIDNLTSSTMHYADEFFLGHVVPAINREIAETLSEGALARPNLQPIFETLKDRLRETPYFNLVAASTASRSYHYGYLKAAQVQGYTTVTFAAVIDTRTSLICESLNGKSYRLADAVDVYERAVAAQNTDELKTAAPWFSGRNQTDVDAYENSVSVPTPPLHGYCRSTLLVS